MRSPSAKKMGMSAKRLREVLLFVCSVEFWRMAVLWSIALITSYFQLLLQSLHIQKSYSYPRRSPETSAFRPVCIITGATSGLGAAAARALSKESFTIVLVGRTPDALSKTAAEIRKFNKEAHLKAFEVDISDFRSIFHFKESLQQWLQDSNMHPSVQLLINNAGILATSPRKTAEGYDEMMATNYIGAFCLTQLLLPLLINSPVPSRIVNVTSFTHRTVGSMQVDRQAVEGKCFLRSKQYLFAQAYEYSKFCLLLFSYALHRKIGLMEKASHVSVIPADPGVVKTNLMREVPPFLSSLAFAVLKLMGLLQSPDDGVRSIIDAALAPPEALGVYFFSGNGRTINSSPFSYNAKLASELWSASCDLFTELELAYKES
ncbi:dehydrogenase/reductase SDR family member on chromosome X-like isoform X2 [Punica granatum]|uniref:Dehydrogenase/reductase SDR family member on chromosome X-like isoform X2 n=1 Tax=Punica granatum TaxID=22663 RepID=A0A6P8BWN6_PUNGR|nr:dehydrogenase/reductase SDR family member on chromosome X-like isoform X2 [Punica granatum]